MQRKLLDTLLRWKKSEKHKPIILKGARQVGKSYLAKELGKTFKTFVEINFDDSEDIHTIFAHDLDPHRIIKEISIITGQEIVPGKTLLFFDEVQESPRAIKSLRYFYEKMPDLHLIAAGSLLDFTLEQIGLPVGRVTPLYLYPLSFSEFVAAKGESTLLQAATEYFPQEVPESIHQKLIKIWGEYIAIGGMPEVVSEWIEKENFQLCRDIQDALVDVYRTDFQKYAKSHQIKYVDLLYQKIPQMVGKKFIYSSIDSDYQARELKPALDLLTKAGIVHKIYHSSTSRAPLKAGAKLDFFKVILSDVGLMQAILNQNISTWIIDPSEAAQHAGDVVEAFVGQEILASYPPNKQYELFYWAREKRNSSAEVDYLFEHNETIIPVEVKAGKSTKLKSLKIYLQEKKASPYGIHFSPQNNKDTRAIRHFPLYLVGSLLSILKRLQQRETNE